MAEYEKIEEKKVEKKPKLEKVFIPRIPGEDRYTNITVNGKTTTIENGREVEVSRSVASVVKNMLQARYDAEEFAEASSFKG